MNKLEQFLRDNPSYCKCGNQRIADACGISINTVARFKNSQTYKKINKTYRNTL